MRCIECLLLLSVATSLLFNLMSIIFGYSFKMGNCDFSILMNIWLIVDGIIGIIVTDIEIISYFCTQTSNRNFISVDDVMNYMFSKCRFLKFTTICSLILSIVGFIVFAYYCTVHCMNYSISMYYICSCPFKFVKITVRLSAYKESMVNEQHGTLITEPSIVVEQPTFYQGVTNVIH